jgi:regulator of protease activity HflC (stomatin/prohibitin superfamily)
MEIMSKPNVEEKEALLSTQAEREERRRLVSDKAVLKNELPNGSPCCPSAAACLLSTVCFCPWLCNCLIVPEREEVVMLEFGKFFGVLKEPGCYCVNGLALSTSRVSTKKQTLDLKNVKVADARGAPLDLSAIVTYKVHNSKAAALDVGSVHDFVSNAGLSVLKMIASKCAWRARVDAPLRADLSLHACARADPYDSSDGRPSLKSEAEKISEDVSLRGGHFSPRTRVRSRTHSRAQMVDMLHHRVKAAGVLVISFELTDLAYAPEIAGAMLIRQQAAALLDARKIIVEGAVEMTSGAIKGLQERGLRLDPSEQARVVGNLLVTVCSDRGVQPTVSVSSSH